MEKRGLHAIDLAKPNCNNLNCKLVINWHLMSERKLVQEILNWKFMYTFWIVSYIVYQVLDRTCSTSIPSLLYWGLLGIITTIAGCYHAYQKRWIEALLYFCLFLFPQVVTPFME